MTEDRALEIITAYGADSARWPDGERSAVLAFVAQPLVASALAQARTLDALLGDWAGADVVAQPFDAARLRPASAQPAVNPLRHRWIAGTMAGRRWIAAGALAAAVVAAVALTPMQSLGGSVGSESPVPQIALNTPVSSVPSATATGEYGSDAGFAYVFTPTVDEDALI